MNDAQMALRKAIAAEVGGLMGRRRMTQTQLSEATGLTQSYISRRLACVKGFDVEELAIIADHFGKNVDDLVRDARSVAEASLAESHHSGVV